MNPTLQLVDVTFKAPKELNDVRVALTDLVADIVAGKSVADIAATRFAEFFEAVKNAQAIPVEAKEAVRNTAALSGYLGGDITGLILEGKKS